VGLRDRIKGRLNRLRDGVEAVRDEAKYPGRPANHRIADNPIYATGADRQAREEATAATTRRAEATALPDPTVRPENDAAASGDFWYLDGSEEDQGWDETDAIKTSKEDETDATKTSKEND
jgi:hypothetical protein